MSSRQKAPWVEFTDLVIQMCVYLRRRLVHHDDVGSP